MEDMIEKLLDENNDEPIEFYDENGKKMVFEQCAVIPYKDGVFCILSPTEKVRGIMPGTAVVFELIKFDGQNALKMVEEQRVANKIFKMYEKMLEDYWN